MAPDLLRSVLRAAAKRTPANVAPDIGIDGELVGESASALDATLRYCYERGYIELWETPERFGGRSEWLVKHLTANGHNKLRSP